MTATHPTDDTLAALIDDELDDTTAARVRDHVETCERCQFRTGAAGAAIETPTALRNFRIAFDPVNDFVDVLPAVDDIWRIAWDATSLLGWVRDVTSERISVAPVIDADDADDRFLIVPDGLSDIEPIGVGVDFVTLVPWAVLAARVSHLPRDTIQGSWERGRRVVSTSDFRIESLDELAGDLDELAAAVWLPAGAQAPSAADLPSETLLDAGVAGDRVLQIVRGAPPTEPEADRIAAQTGTRPSTAPAVPDALRHLIDQPRFKRRICDYAQRHGQTERAARLDLATAALPSQLAARGPADAEPDYERILNRLLDG